MSHKRLVVSVVGVTVGLLVLSACGGSGETPVGIGVAAGQEQQAAKEVPKSPAAVSLNAAEIDGLGEVLTDQNGMTLYRFNRDTTDPPRSRCNGDCAVAWPPVLADGDVVVSGVDKSLIGSVTRSDGSVQVTVDNWPVYRFAKDKKPGEAEGQGVGDVWYAVTPEGRKAGVAAPVEIVSTDLPGFGNALTDQDGFTLYLFAKDGKDPSKSRCNGECAQKWPPVLVDGGEPELSGVDPAIVGTVVRDDGTRQVTVGGWPVYRYTKDTGPGQTNGHGVQGTWFVIESAGCKSLAPAKLGQAPDADDEPESDSGY